MYIYFAFDKYSIAFAQFLRGGRRSVLLNIDSAIFYSRNSVSVENELRPGISNGIQNDGHVIAVLAVVNAYYAVIIFAVPYGVFYGKRNCISGYVRKIDSIGVACGIIVRYFKSVTV